MKNYFLILLLISGGCVSKESNKVTVQKMYQDIMLEFNNVPELKITDVKKSKNKIQLVDVREKSERQVSIIPGAISVTEYEKNIDKYKDKKIVVYCTIGYRSAKYVKNLKKKNINAFNLEGSLLGWVHHGGKLVTSTGEELKKAHVYGKSWNYLPDGYEAIW